MNTAPQLSSHLTTVLRTLDGLSYRANSKSLPHPVDMWRLDGLYAADVDNDRFVLTEAWRAKLKTAA
jgi:hypothetical protein